MSEEKQSTPEEVKKGVAVLGAISLVLGAYGTIGSIIYAGGLHLPGLAEQLASGIGLVAALVGWGAAAVSGVGLLMRAAWGRRLGIIWGKVITWVLPIGFGLAADGLGDFISIDFAIIIVVCLYGNILAQNLARDEFDVAFE